MIREGEPRWPSEDVSLDDPAMILYTSGTTGCPKGAALTHGNLTWNTINVLVDYDVLGTDVALMISPLFHVASLGMGALPALLKGATVILEGKFDAGRTLGQIQARRVTSLSGVPTTFQMLAGHPAWGSTDLSSLRVLTCGGSPVPLAVRQAYEQRGLSFTSGYGMTEAAPGVASMPPRWSRRKAGAAGLQPRIARYKIPKRVLVVDELPRTATGKVRKAELRQRYATQARDPAHRKEETGCPSAER